MAENSPRRENEGDNLFAYTLDTNVLMHVSDNSILEEAQFRSLQCRTSKIKVLYVVGNEQKSLNVQIGSPQTLDAILHKILTAVNKMRSIITKINNLVTSDITATEETTPSSSNTKDTIDWHALVYQEEAYRQSDEILNQYAVIESDASPQDWITFTANVIQPYILSSNGIEPNAFNLHKLRVAAGETDVFWVKHNRARQGNLQGGDLIPPTVTLHDVAQGCPLSIQQMSCTTTRPVVLLAGSIS